MRRWLLLSVLLHVALAMGGAHGAMRAASSEHDDPRPIAFELTIDARTETRSIAGDAGKTRVGLPSRPTGEPDTRARGHAGVRDDERGRDVHRRGRDAEDRLTTPADARTLAQTLGDLLRASDPTSATLGVTSPVPARGSRDDATLGLTSTGTLVSPGTRGLDMTGTGRGSGPRGERDATIGERALGLGSLGASRTRYYVPRTRVREDVCVTMEQGCPHRRPRLVIAVEVVHGALAASDAGRTARRARTEIVSCAPALPMRIELAVSADGRVQAAFASPAAPCEEATVTALRFSSASAPSLVRITLQRVLF